jgi:hypothetical protein
MTSMTKERAAQELLARAAREHAPAALACSLSAEDMVLTDLAARARLAIEIFVLDARRVDRGRGVGHHAPQRRAGEPALRAGLPLDRLRAAHAAGAFILMEEATHRTVAAGMIE